MRFVLRFVGSLLIVGSAVGLSLVGATALAPDDLVPPWVGPLVRVVDEEPTATMAPRAVIQASSQSASEPITHIAIERIGLTADVVESPLVERDGALTWDVPAFKVGHAATTANANQPGNAVLLGHVTSLRSGNVFATLDQVIPGDVVKVNDHVYNVVSVESIDRTDTSVLDQDSKVPAVSLVTCTGVWLPTIWDYTQRLVVRAEKSVV
jgi:LPXTG-site transpeptidase (sortase) family protein